MKKTVAVLLFLSMILCLPGCKGKSKSNRPDRDALNAANVGSYIFIGEYEQDNNEATGKEAIEWLVLAKEKDRMLVISRYALDCKPYNEEWVGATWETCSLRAWLNQTFYDVAFIPEEKNVIMDTTVTAAANPKYVTEEGNDTTDKLFLLSLEEAERYFLNDSTRGCRGTPSCYALGAFESEEKCMWWVRSPGYNPSMAACVRSDGRTDYTGLTNNVERVAVRPAMWIDLKP